MNQSSKYAIVVDANGNKVEFVLTLLTDVPAINADGVQSVDDDGKLVTKKAYVPHGYTLKFEERLVFDNVSTALSLKKPRWNGQSWDETATEEEIEATLPSLEDVRAAKLLELGRACEAAIHAGVTVKTQNGTEHFALTINDQTNIANLAMQAQAGAAVLYHADGELCRTFAPEEMISLAAAAIAHKTRHTTLCNHYNVWTRRVQSRAELTAITYGCPLPSDLAESVQALMSWGDSNE